MRAAAIDLRDLLEELTLPSWIKTSGSKGFHIVVPLDGKTRIGQVARFANAVGKVFVSLSPITLRRSSARPIVAGGSMSIRKKRLQCHVCAAYTVRAKRGAPVSAPCTWEEVERGEVDPRTFTLRNMLDRVAKVGDLWADMRRRGRSLKRATEKLKLRVAQHLFEEGQRAGIVRLAKPQHGLLADDRMVCEPASSMRSGTPSSLGSWLNANTACFFTSTSGSLSMACVMTPAACDSARRAIQKSARWRSLGTPFFAKSRIAADAAASRWSAIADNGSRIGRAQSTAWSPAS